MSDIVIKAEHLGKRYVIGHQTAGGTTFREALVRNVRELWNKTRDLTRGKPIIQGDRQEEVWALKDVGFEIKRGEAIGIIGRNGAGKSTLLKILSRITEPTEGRVTIRGRVAGLLEVGTGFHSELTGRENIYLNGTILGMTRAEIRKKFDEIVAFAEVEKYLDTPVKRYSSGMYVRLGFAVAAHRDPDILLVDEVLAVGDAQFYTKCTNKMNEIREKGTTILLVSHNMWLIQTVCERVFLIDEGRILRVGDPFPVIQDYYGLQEQAAEKDSLEEEKAVVIGFAEVRDPNGNPVKETLPDGGLVIAALYQCRQEGFRGHFFLRVTTPDGFPLYTAYSKPRTFTSGRGATEAFIPSFSLLEGEYRIWVGVCGLDKEKEKVSERMLKIDVLADPGYPDPKFGKFFNKVIWKDDGVG